MSTADRDGDGTAGEPPDVAERLRGASFVRIVARGDGDGVAAAGVLARALADLGTPFQVATARTAAARADRIERAAGRAGDDEPTVAVGDPGTAPTDVLRPDAGADPATPDSVAAWRVARDLVDDPADGLALAGAVAAGVTPGADGTAPALERAREAGLGRRPGVAVPVADLADGLAHSTLVHAPFSGAPERARSALADAGVDPGADDADAEVGRRVASLVAVEATGHEAATPGSADAVERALRPAVPGERFHTLGGEADVLDAVARAAPGTAVALALGRDVKDAALSAWRDHAARAHSTVRAATTARYDGLLAARVDASDAPVGTAVRLLAAYRSPEPAALVVGPGRGGAAAPGGDVDVGHAIRSAADAVGGRADGTPRRAYAEFGADPTEFIAAFREALS
jgi:hypothetical protein